MQQLTPEQVEHFQVEGYLILREVFDADEVSELLDATSSFLRATRRGTSGANFDLWTDEPGDDLNPHRVTYLNDVFLMHDRLDAHMRDPKLLGVFCDLFGSDINGFQSATVVKPNQINFDYHGWHQDAPDYIPLSNYKNACALTYLGEMGSDTGGTSLVPRSHRCGLFKRGSEKVDGWPMTKRIIFGFDKFEPRAITPQFHPGDLLVFDSWIMHRANSNFTDRTKIGLINVFQSADCIDLSDRNKFKVANLPITRGGKVLTREESFALRGPLEST